MDQSRRVSLTNNYTKTISSPTGSNNKWRRKQSLFGDEGRNIYCFPDILIYRSLHMISNVSNYHIFVFIDKDISFKELLKSFSTTSTLHGISFVGTSGSVLTKLIWLAIVITGLVLSIIGIDQCFKGWEQNPVITAVWQVPIESTPFPSVTICPIGDER